MKVSQGHTIKNNKNNNNKTHHNEGNKALQN